MNLFDMFDQKPNWRCDVTDKKYILKIEGQELTIPTEVGGLEMPI